MRAILLFLFVLIAGETFAQEKLNTVQQAMRDEMERNLKELKTEGFDKPFFINYTIQDETLYHIRATLGALTQSQESKARSALSLRMLVGDYEFNDESLDNNLFSPPQANAIGLPLDDDYLGIRRSLWISTDNVYRNASRQFAKNKEMVKEQGKPLAELPHRTFAKVSPSKIHIESPEVKFDKAATEEYVRKVSGVFGEFKEIESSDVAFVYSNGIRYLVNSEGSINRIPVSYMRLVVSCRLRGRSGEMLMDNFTRYAITPELPAIDKTIEDARTLAKNLIASVSLAKLDEEYNGPILFEGKEAASTFYMGLFMLETSLFSSNDIAPLKGSRYNPGASVSEPKIGKQIFMKGMTVKAIPKTKKFSDVQLLGSFEVDGEGVVPADETVLVESGVLKQLCNDRTLTKSDQVANGLGDGPGVVSVSFDKGAPLASMKAKLIEQAKKEGLEYAIRVTSGSGGTYQGQMYKVYVTDGREEPISMENASTGLEQRSFRKILETSNEVAAYNIGSGEAVTSIICPQALLIEEVNIRIFGDRTSEKEEDYVPSPLKK
ncbi:MAG TPA: metallopeptidase TldD-related protein [Cyclobacteriaceae bacterium]|nr:metallopeptidase TldD-related protein [Cyclobacteriaceae bacterium]